MKQRNEKNIAKRAAKYRKVLASDFHKQLRYRAWMRAAGRCECTECRTLREGPWKTIPTDGERLLMAWEPIPVWFVQRGGEPYKRFRSTEGEIHHTSYRLYGDENPDELKLVRWMWKAHHQAIEREHGTRRRYLAGTK
jgi:hypothetical protein